MKKRKFNKIEKKIMRLLYKTEAFFSIYEVAKECGLSYVTAEKYLFKLLEDGILETKSEQKKRTDNV